MTDTELWLPPPVVEIQDDGVLDILDGVENLQGLLGRAIVTRDMVADNAHHYSSTGFYFGLGQCLKFSRSCALAPGGVYDANAAWSNADYKHTDGPGPRGSWSFYRVGDHGHVTVNEGDGWEWTTDYRRAGKVDLVQGDELRRNWNMVRRGWTEDINGVHPISGSGDWFDMATKAELDEVVQDRLLKFVDGSAFHDAVLEISKEALNSGAGVNMVREGVQQELGDENVGELSDRIAKKVWAVEVTDPSDNQVKTMKTIVRYSAFRAKKIVTSLGGKWS